MSRISLKFAELADKKQKLLIAYIMAGYPNNKTTISAVNGLVKGGADIIELGFPFSDPLADGPVIQDAANSSLQHGASIGKFFALTKKIKKQTDIPLVMMTYTNIPYRMGYDRFVLEAKNSGIDGVILPDMSIEESGQYVMSARGVLDTIFLISPNTSKHRIKKIAGMSSGFLYLVAVYGTTGTRKGIQDYSLRAIREAKRQTGSSMPIGVGFGVSTPADVRRYVSSGADAVIVGSAFLKLIKNTPSSLLEDKMEAFTRSLKRQTV